MQVKSEAREGRRMQAGKHRLMQWILSVDSSAASNLLHQGSGCPGSTRFWQTLSQTVYFFCSKMQSLEAIRAALPLSSPLPPNLDAIPSADLNLEHELARNPTNLSRWFSYIKHIKDDLVAIGLSERGTETSTSVEKQVLGKKLSNPSSRQGFQRLCSVYERALLHFPVSYKLWNSYLTWRREYVTGTVEKAQRVKLNAPKPRVDLAENEKLYGLLKADRDGTVTLAERDWDGNVVDPKWEGSLDGLIGLEEWQSLAGAYERALTCMPMVRLSLQNNSS